MVNAKVIIYNRDTNEYFAVNEENDMQQGHPRYKQLSRARHEMAFHNRCKAEGVWSAIGNVMAGIGNVMAGIGNAISVVGKQIGRVAR